MKIILWSLLALFLIGDALFVLPYHLSSDKITSTYDVNYKKDSLLLKNVFQDSSIQVRLNLPPLYEAIYKSPDSIAKKPENPFFILVNVSVLHNLDFTAVSFPFYKVTSFKGIIPFYSIIKASNAPGMDSTALVGNITINGKLSIKGICSPVYAKTMVEKELVRIFQKEMNKVELDINRHPIADTVVQIITPEPQVQKTHPKRKKK
ncbi:MAG TPA: hypothetical protein VK645_12850 [Chitinophagaceae bacterium]|nr:hypothetical protein [Chitinophagaceae bacterium]